jgi:hypothetical protein
MNLTWGGFETEILVPVTIATSIGALSFFALFVFFLYYRGLLTF